MPKIKDIHGVTQSHRAYDVLRELLILRRIPAGERLGESQWSQQLGVSRGALREALSRLHSEGLAVEGAKCGYFVPSYTPEELDEITEVRVMVETGAISQIIRAERNRGDHMKRLHELCDELEWILDRDYGIEIAEPDHRFHEALAELSGNRRLILLHRCLPQTIGSDPRARTVDRAVQARQVLEDHRAILHALRRGRVESARQVLRRHYDTSQTEEEYGVELLAVAR
jgi:DNA-binding GntR family transcriptional regulator